MKKSLNTHALAFIPLALFIGDIQHWPKEVTLKVGSQDCKNGFNYRAKVATTAKSLAKGLSGKRRPLKANEGMLFVFNPPGPKTFWMKDTWIPLSVLFFGEQSGLLSLQKMDVEADPANPIHYYSESKPVFAALEIDQKAAGRLNKKFTYLCIQR